MCIRDRGCGARRGGRYVRFSVAGPLGQRVVRYLIGVVGLFVIWQGLSLVFPREPLALGLGLRILRYGLAMFWAIAAWPWLFVRVGLGTRAGQEAEHSGEAAAHA